MLRSLLACSLLLGLVGCADDDRLNVSGSVAIDVDGSSTGFAFDQRTRLLEEDLVEPGDTLLAGHCTIGETEEGEFVSVAVSRPDAPAEGIQARRFRIRMPTDGTDRGAFVTADLGGTEFRADVGADCSATVDYVSRGDDIAGLMFDCTLRDGEGNPATAQGELHFGGCGDQGGD